MKKLLKYINLLLVVLLLASCEGYLDINDDPNNPTSVTPDLILPVAQKYSADVIHNGRRANTIGNMMMYNWSQSDGFSWYTDEFNYLVNTSFYTGIFNNSYSNALKQYQVLATLDAESGMYDNYIAIAMIMKAWHFQLLVDFYGDIPYSEALQRGGDATPKYDDAQTIYEDLIVQLTAAIDKIENASVNAEDPAANDIMFGGNMTYWKQFANSVKLRILTRQMSMTGRDTYIQTEMDAIVAEGSGFLGMDVAVNPGYLKEEGKQNPMWNLYGWDAGGNITLTNDATCATDFVINYLTTIADPRIDFIYEAPATGHLGVPQGLTPSQYDNPVVDAFQPDLVSNLGPGILKSYDMDAVIMTLAEINFNVAEATLKGFLTGSAQAAYEAGVQASFTFLGAGSAAGYLSSGTSYVEWGQGDNLETIITQKWIAVNSITAEQSWFDYNRTGFPRNLPVPLNQSYTERPVRLAYPAGEISANGENVPDQPDVFSTKVFWGN